MGFIEKLRQQKEVEAQVNLQRQDKLLRRAEAEEAARKQREAQEREFHDQRRKQAGVFRQESGIGDLVKELGEILVKETILGNIHESGDWGSFTKAGKVSRGFSRGPDYNNSRGSRSEIPVIYPDITPVDQDSILDIAIWDVKELGTKYGNREGWKEAKQNFLAVETQSDGTIIFHAGKQVTKTMQEWRTNRVTLDSALEEAFNSHGIHKIQYGYWKEYVGVSAG